VPASITYGSAEVNALINTLVDDGLISASDPNQVTTLRSQLAQLPTTLPDPLPGTLNEFFRDSLVADAHVGLEYREDGTEPSPAIVDASCCAGTSCFPTRTQEGVFIAVSATAFPAIADPHQQALDSLGPPPTTGGAVDCAALQQNLATAVFGLWRDIAPVTDACGDALFPIVPLAFVHWSRYAGAGGQILSIDNFSERPLAPGGPVLRALSESLAGCASGGD
jgi:hypothetical protein